MCFHQRDVQVFFMRVRFIFQEGQKYFQKEQNRARGAQKFLTPLTFVLFLGHNRQEGEGVEYLIIAKERLVLVSAPFAPHDSFIHQGHTNLISIMGRFIRGHNAPYAPQLDTPLVFTSSIIKQMQEEQLMREKKNNNFI